MKKSLFISLLLLSLFCTAAWLDKTLAAKFYTPIPGERGHFIENGITQFFYNWGEYPAFILGALSFLVFVFSFLHKKIASWRKGAFALGLTLFLGSGLIVNLGLKEHIERPRPRQIEEFGGKYTFKPIYKPHFIAKQNPDDGQKSFPSGHVTMGFYFLSLYYVGKRYQSKILAHTALWITFLLGGALMLTRMAQGAHFFSDVVSAALIMWFTSYMVTRITWKVASRWRVLNSDNTSPTHSLPREE